MPLEICHLLRLNQKEIENLNRSTTGKEIISVVKNLPTKAQDQALVNFTK